MYCFGNFRLHAHMLECGSQRVHLSPKALDTLRVLVEARGEVVDKDELMQRVWPDAFVQETGLARNISVLRKTVEEAGGSASWIETLPKRGYRFTAPVTESSPVAIPVIEPQKSSGSSIAAVVAVVALAAGWALWPNSPSDTPGSPQAPQVLIAFHLLGKSSPEDVRRSVVGFERAIEEDPESAVAHSGFADATLALVKMAGAPQQALRAAESAAERAVALDPTFADAHATLGALRLESSWDFDSAGESLRAALELDPKSLRALYYEARRLTALRRFDDALVLLDKAREIDPVAAFIADEQAYIYYAKGDFAVARDLFERVLERERSDAHAHYYLALTLAFMGEFDAASTSLQQSDLGAEIRETDEAWIQARRGNTMPMRNRYEELQRRVREDGLESASLLLPASTLGEIAEGIRALETSFGSHAPELIHMLSDPRMELLRSHPRFRDLYVRHGLGGAFASSDE